MWHVVRKSTTVAPPAAEDRSDMCPDLRDDRAIIDLCITTRASALGLQLDKKPLAPEGRQNRDIQFLSPLRGFGNDF